MFSSCRFVFICCMRRIVVLYLASLDQWITSPFLVFFSYLLHCLSLVTLLLYVDVDSVSYVRFILFSVSCFSGNFFEFIICSIIVLVWFLFCHILYSVCSAPSCLCVNHCAVYPTAVAYEVCGWFMALYSWLAHFNWPVWVPGTVVIE